MSSLCALTLIHSQYTLIHSQYTLIHSQYTRKNEEGGESAYHGLRGIDR
jgi:hypothetical protein